MNQTMKRILISALAVLVLLSACGPQAAPTQDPALVQQLIEQSVQLTVAAQNLETAQAVPPATETPVPTNTVPPTIEVLLPTATPFVVVPPTVVSSGSGGSGGSGGTTVKPEYACNIIHQRPFDYEEFAKGDDFDVRWTFVNIGTKPWRAGTDLKYSYGPKMTTIMLIELPEIKPGGQYEVIMDAVAPTEAGTQLMVWSLEGVNCTPYVAIVVK
jgi:hypothetical protein